MDRIWELRPQDYLDLEGESRLAVVHPWLRKRVRQLDPSRVLDFGSGDGILFHGCSSAFEELCLYDTSAPMLSIARARYASQPNVMFASAPRELAESRYDVVVCSLVLMTIDNQADFRAAVHLMYSAATEGGTVLVAVTHPCFRDHSFSTIETDWDDDTHRYLCEGAPFRVRLYDERRGKSVEFTDFHWTLAFTVNAFLNAGFALMTLAEISDRSSTGLLRRDDVPPYLVLELVRPKS